VPELPHPDALDDGTVRLRPWADRDLGCVERASADAEIPQGTTVPAQYTPEEGLAFIRRQHERLTSGQGVSLAITSASTDEASGLVIIQSRPQAGVVGLGYWVLPDARGRGLAGRAVTLAADWALGAGGYARVEAWVRPDNIPSRRTLEHCGFDLEGRLRSFLVLGEARSDALVYSRVAAEC
jgi:[ribosomal protein S5]-alanine N-acetyltransferase